MRADASDPKQSRRPFVVSGVSIPMNRTFSPPLTHSVSPSTCLVTDVNSPGAPSAARAVVVVDGADVDSGVGDVISDDVVVDGCSIARSVRPAGASSPVAAAATTITRPAINSCVLGRRRRYARHTLAMILIGLVPTAVDPPPLRSAGSRGS